MKTLAQDTIIANARFFGGNVDLVPKQVKLSSYQVHHKLHCAESFGGPAGPNFYGDLQTLSFAAQRSMVFVLTCVLACGIKIGAEI